MKDLKQIIIDNDRAFLAGQISNDDYLEREGLQPPVNPDGWADCAVPVLCIFEDQTADVELVPEVSVVWNIGRITMIRSGYSNDGPGTFEDFCSAMSKAMNPDPCDGCPGPDEVECSCGETCRENEALEAYHEEHEEEALEAEFEYQDDICVDLGDGSATEAMQALNEALNISQAVEQSMLNCRVALGTCIDNWAAAAPMCAFQVEHSDHVECTHNGNLDLANGDDWNPDDVYRCNFNCCPRVHS